jgi:flavin reductase (DIM6/NTAB) family NADH-FMN oxidoreductase RutF
MTKRTLKPHTRLFPLPVVLTTCVDKDGNPNIITLAWVGIVCSEPPQISISVRHQRYSCELIMESREFRPPLIKECPYNIECKVVRELDLGSHVMFIGEVVAMHVDEEILDENGAIDYRKAKPFSYCATGYWTLDREIGCYGYTLKEKRGR